MIHLGSHAADDSLVLALHPFPDPQAMRLVVGPQQSGRRPSDWPAPPTWLRGSSARVTCTKPPPPSDLCELRWLRLSIPFARPSPSRGAGQRVPLPGLLATALGDIGGFKGPHAPVGGRI